MNAMAQATALNISSRSAEPAPAATAAATAADVKDILNRQQEKLLATVLKRVGPEEGNQIQSELLALLRSPRHSELASPEARNELINSTLRALAHPYEVHQANLRTCTVAAGIEARLLKEQPATYLRLINQLTSENGSANLPGGGELQYVPNSSKLSDRDNAPSARSLATRVFQSACMQFAAGQERLPNGQLVLQYDPIKDSTIDRSGGSGFTGAFPDMFQRLNNHIFNETTKRHDVAGSHKESTTAIMDSVKSDLAQGRLVACEVGWGKNDHAKHMLLVTEVKDGRVYFYNGWQKHVAVSGDHKVKNGDLGKIESLPIKDFEARLISAYTKTASGCSDQLTPLDSNRQYDRTPGRGLQHAGIDPQKEQGSEMLAQTVQVPISNSALTELNTPALASTGQSFRVQHLAGAPEDLFKRRKIEEL